MRDQVLVKANGANCDICYIEILVLGYQLQLVRLAGKLIKAPYFKTFRTVLWGIGKWDLPQGC